MRRSLSTLASGVCLLLLGSACDSKTETEVATKAPPASEAKPKTPAAAPPAEADKKPAKSEKRRDAPPEGIDAAALAVGQPSPALEDLPSTTGTWSRGSAPAIVVFYRGFW